MTKFVVVVFISAINWGGCLEFKYHSNSELAEFLTNYTATTSEFFTRLYSIGKSAKGENLTVIEVTATNTTKYGIPNVKLIGNINGNEPVGREILLQFLEYIRDQFENDANVNWLLKNTRIHILPSLNPDGFNNAIERCTGDIGRKNGHNINLNRNFPDYFHKNPTPLQPETEAVQNWMLRIPFILSASLLGGSVVANYPFDSSREIKWKTFVKELKEIKDDPDKESKLRDEYLEIFQAHEDLTRRRKRKHSTTPDDDVFKNLAQVYSRNHLTMHKGNECRGDSFPGGITNGAAWYAFVGGMQDYNYAMHGCYELSLGVSCCKYPNRNSLSTLWEENKKALLSFLFEAHKGVTGRILDEDTGDGVEFAKLKIIGRDIYFNSTKTGEFWRLLLAGNYQIEIEANSYHKKIVEFTIHKQNGSYPKLEFLEIFLTDSSKPLPTTVEQTTVPPTKATTKINEITTNICYYFQELYMRKENTPQKHSREVSFAINLGSTHLKYISFLIFTIFFIQ